MSGLRVMVVSEHPVLRDILGRLVEERGFEAYKAADGIDALRQIYTVKPRVMVTDAALPCLSGFELLPFVRRRFPEIGVIALYEKRNGEENLADEYSDVLLPMDPLNPTLLSDTIAGVMAEYPFRHVREIGVRKPVPAGNGCTQCEQLQKRIAMARLNSLLARVWRSMHAGDVQAERQECDAANVYSEALTEMERHQGSLHGVERTRVVGNTIEFEVKGRCANG